MTPTSPLDLSPEPDLHPLYPTTAHLAVDLSSHSGLSPDQKNQLVKHVLTRACVYGELSILQYLFSDSNAQPYIDLGLCDEDGVGLVSLTIAGFGSESDRDVEREECVRLLVAQGAEVGPDKSGWTPLHHAALLSPPTLISYLLTHGCSPFDTTKRGLTPLDIITAHSLMPGRDDVALLLEESMRGEGWTGGRVEEKRREFEQRMKRKRKRDNIRDDVGKALEIPPQWWNSGNGSDSEESDLDEEGSDFEDDGNDAIYTPPADYASMLVFSPASLPHIFDSLVTNYPPSFRDSTPANLLYMLARFACLTCDHTWLEDFMLGATEAIEDTFFSRPEDITCLVFWLHNTTVWLHLMQCDNSINEACEMLGSFELIEETINSVFVFIIRLAERKIDSLLDAALLDFASLGSEFESVQFESEWSFFRSLTGSNKKKVAAPSGTTSNASTMRGSPLPPPPVTPSSPGRPPSPSPSVASSFSSIRQSFTRARAGSVAAQAMFSSVNEGEPSPAQLTSYLTALQTLLTLSNINPALITQLWSQVMYWTSCEMFNRVLTRKKYICRSRAVQIGMNLSVLEEWVTQMGLPKGVQSHFNPVRELLHWLQCLSSITEFPDLVATIQTMKNINPLQMRRAVRDYKYEVNEGRMTEECIQYLTQLQKDWERHRVKLGVEALRKEQLGERERDRDGSVSPAQAQDASDSNSSMISSSSSDINAVQEGIDSLFDKARDKSTWEPAQPPKVLGELLDSRYMLPLVFPSNPRMLGVSPGMIPFREESGHGHGGGLSPPRTPLPRSSSRASTASGSGSHHGAMRWRSNNGKLRVVGASSLKWVDGIVSASRWGRPVLDDEAGPQDQEQEDGDDNDSASANGNGRSNGEGEAVNNQDYSQDEHELRIDTRITPLTRKPSGRGKGRASHGGGETTPVDSRT